MREDGFPELVRDERFPGLLVLRDFDGHLTHFHGCFTCSRGQSGKSVFEILGFRAKLLATIAPRVRLHGNNVCLLRPVRHEAFDRLERLRGWMESYGFDLARPPQRYSASAESPFEDGFFQCLCLRTIDAGPPNDDRLLTWRVLAAGSQSLANSRSTKDALVDFVENETARCDELLRNRRYELPCGRLFDAENADLEFAASVVSRNEFRLWSRPVSYPD